MRGEFLSAIELVPDMMPRRVKVGWTAHPELSGKRDFCVPVDLDALRRPYRAETATEPSRYTSIARLCAPARARG